MSELGVFLRSRRERVRPAQVGLPAGSRRRVRGLRREEVALLADVSVPYYALLEQGREVRPSAGVLDALARALRLPPPEHALLYRLAGADPPAGSGPEVVSAGVVDLVARLDPCPTYVTGRNWDVLAANRAARALFGVFDNLLVFMFTDPRARYVYVEWEREAAAQLARFRAASAHRREASDVVALVSRLRDASDEAARWWASPDVAPLSAGSKLLRHPSVGEVRLEHVVLVVADAPDQKVVTFRGPEDQLRTLATSSV
ncbi:helix-turn-helix transcriptional regulator [Cryptosporangium phraense]|uniref:Helix-turn-helix domain-containing protein n=1 Tax=Cryptosporangium phraense TaxID=2593070 RepID=A0A545ALS6_9ACTN|nr:helix-turn-helix transcriptional regulator [Cryptosporangium phraense]TQS42241.1 helix-turn-helix domain-containing protein [Cryptosporangium phraense]